MALRAVWFYCDLNFKSHVYNKSLHYVAAAILRETASSSKQEERSRRDNPKSHRVCHVGPKTPLQNHFCRDGNSEVCIPMASGHFSTVSNIYLREWSLESKFVWVKVSVQAWPCFLAVGLCCPSALPVVFHMLLQQQETKLLFPTLVWTELPVVRGSALNSLYLRLHRLVLQGAATPCLSKPWILYFAIRGYTCQ